MDSGVRRVSFEDKSSSPSVIGGDSSAEPKVKTTLGDKIRNISWVKTASTKMNESTALHKMKMAASDSKAFISDHNPYSQRVKQADRKIALINPFSSHASTARKAAAIAGGILAVTGVAVIIAGAAGGISAPIGIAAGALMVGAGAALMAGSSIDSGISKVQDKLDEKMEKMEKIVGKMAVKPEELKKAFKELKNLEASAARTSNRISSLEWEKDLRQGKIGDLKEQIQNLKEQENPDHLKLARLENKLNILNAASTDDDKITGLKEKDNSINDRLFVLRGLVEDKLLGKEENTLLEKFYVKESSLDRKNLDSAENRVTLLIKEIRKDQGEPVSEETSVKMNIREKLKVKKDSVKLFFTSGSAEEKLQDLKFELTDLKERITFNDKKIGKYVKDEDVKNRLKDFNKDALKRIEEQIKTIKTALGEELLEEEKNPTID